MTSPSKDVFILVLDGELQSDRHHTLEDARANGAYTASADFRLPAKVEIFKLVESGTIDAQVTWS